LSTGRSRKLPANSNAERTSGQVRIDVGDRCATAWNERVGSPMVLASPASTEFDVEGGSWPS
ncbi:MAG: hypothetical protein ACKVIY_16365, partial [Acidimicrobiales bacterium]